MSNSKEESAIYHEAFTFVAKLLQKIKEIESAWTTGCDIVLVREHEDSDYWKIEFDFKSGPDHYQTHIDIEIDGEGLGEREQKQLWENIENVSEKADAIKA